MRRCTSSATSSRCPHSSCSYSSMRLRSAMLAKSSGRSRSRVSGLSPLERNSTCMMASLSYEWPSEATTGSHIFSCVMGQTNSDGRRSSPIPRRCRRRRCCSERRASAATASARRCCERCSSSRSTDMRLSEGCSVASESCSVRARSMALCSSARLSPSAASCNRLSAACWSRRRSIEGEAGGAPRLSGVRSASSSAFELRESSEAMRPSDCCTASEDCVLSAPLLVCSRVINGAKPERRLARAAAACCAASDAAPACRSAISGAIAPASRMALLLVALEAARLASAAAASCAATEAWPA
mmetsp:Transcript_27151/g.67300  ORF Transcript_27151/g.67300 Transcript_27151/m.67300 type:complete len:300 (+) Transcript_27151:1104-2003(+)